ncbi:Os02g0671950 [Oryza sativa Japonica Group]|uniref:Os02g0671950 protein n=1 Tax=Oryza sativa subsp. japonica TaxID=39947 RepID=A0A0P0VMT0_ORYSJ|nr:hypothetical protein EE612_012942 [Oryza sativa]BAS80238.1 Os02g0671950 [Oryza sativa Japonica Group]
MMLNNSRLPMANDRRNLRVQERNHPTLLNLVVVPFMSSATLIL